MRILRLSLCHVRGVEQRDLTFTPDAGSGVVDTTGVVVVEGANEAGKSTLGDALDALLSYKDNSRHAAIRSLKTADRDEAPEIEAELQVGPYRFTYRKRFLKRSSTELRILAPTRAALTGDDAHERVRQILESELDLGLWSSLRLRQGGGLEQLGPGGTSGLAAALSGNAGASAIGDRELGILSAVQQEHDRYRTAGTQRERTVLRDARARVAELTGRLAALDTRRDELQADIDRAARLERSLPDLREQHRETGDRAAALADRLAEIEKLTAQVEDCERDERAAALALGHLVDQRERRSALVAQLAELEDARTGLSAAVARAEVACEAAADRCRAATHALAEARAAQALARRQREQAQRDADHLQDVTRLAALTDRAGLAARATERLREASATIARTRVDQALLSTLRRAHDERIRTRAALDAASPELRFTAARAITVALDGQERTLDAGGVLPWTVDGSVTLELGDLGTLRVTAGAGIDDAVEDHRVATTRLTTALTEAGVEDLAAAEQAHRDRMTAEQDAAAAGGERDRALDGDTPDALAAAIDQLERQVQAVPATRDAEVPLPANAGAARVAVEQAAQAERTEDAAVAAPDAALEQTRSEQTDRQADLVEARIRAEEAERRVVGLTDELTAARQRSTDDDLARDVAAATDGCERARTELAMARTDLAGADPATVTRLAVNAAQVVDEASDRLRDAEVELHALSVRINALGGDGLWEQREDVAVSHTHAQGELDGLVRRAEAATTLLHALERHRGLARERYAAPLHQQLLAYGRMLHGPDFDVELDDDLRISRRTVDGGVWLELGQLSIGAQEQLALLGRLACATLLGDRGGLLLFDDALGSSDPERLELLGAVLREAGEHCQVVVLTCYPDRYRHVGGATRITLDR